MIQINQEHCIGCGLCVQDCIAENLLLQNGKAVAQNDCLKCGHCVAVCPQQAVTIPGYDMDDVEPYHIVIEPGQLLQAIKSRRSIRNYQTKQIKHHVMQDILNAGRYTATAKNTQGCRFVFVQEQLETFKAMVWQQIKEAVERGNLPDTVPPYMLDNYKNFLYLKQQEPSVDFLFRNAPAVLFIAAVTPIDAGLAAQNMELMMLAHGLGALYNGYLNFTIHLAPELLQWLGLEEKKSYICMLFGYPAVHYIKTAPRKSADVIWR